MLTWLAALEESGGTGSLGKKDHVLFYHNALLKKILFDTII